VRPIEEVAMKTRAMFAIMMALLMVRGGAPQSVAARAQTGQQFSSLDQLLAPIALYPDQLLAQMLLCAGDPAKVTEFDRWLKTMETIKGTQLQNAALKAGFEPSFVALALFPQVVSRMAEQIDWTTLLGQAFVADRAAVFDTIQRLRHQAQDVGTLKSTPQQEIATKTTSSGQEVIVIESANPQVVYVPQYNPQVVYTQAPTTVVVQQDNSAAVAAGLIGFTAGIAIGAAMDNNYYYGPYGYHGGGYMYNDAWDDYYDAREDAREDWQDHREDLVDERGDRAENRGEQRTDRQQATGEQRTDRQETRQENRPASQTQSAQGRTAASTATADSQRAGRTGSAEARGYGGDGSKAQAAKERGGSDAFSGYSSGKSTRSSSARGRSSRGGGGGGGRRR
jgi:hypothetical protein